MGIQRAIQRLLVSPQFLFRIERDPATAAPGTAHPISDLELASRLSFFLWSSIPDDELLDLASQGKLRQPGVLKQQVSRMLADSRSDSLISNFAEQWLYLRDIENKRPNEALFADFDESLRDAFHRETDLFLDSVLRGNHSVLDLLRLIIPLSTSGWRNIMAFPMCMAAIFGASLFLPTARVADYWDKGAF